MAPELKSKKRKSAADSSPKPKKLKKSDESTAVKKPSKTRKSAVAEDNTNVAKSPEKAPRKRAADFFETEENGADADTSAKKPKKAKKSKVAEDKPAAPEPTISNGTKSKKSKAVKVQPVVEEVVPAEEEEEDDEDNEDDQTAALLAGFESSEDEGEADAAQKEEGLDVDKLPDLPNSKNLRKKLDKASGADDGPGVLYVGRIPHGFYEHQMRAYFAQFGDLLRLRLSRNRKTGASKHYAFLEFASAAVADIVAKTMDKYLLFNHILQVRVIPPEQVHPNLFKGAGKRFKAVPRNKMEGALLKRGANREGWEKRIGTEEKRRKEKAEKLKSLMGYEYEAPNLKSVDVVPKKVKQIEAAEEAPKLLTEKPHEEAEEGLEIDVVRTVQAEPGAVTVTEKVKVKKGKKGTEEDMKANIVTEKKSKTKSTKANATKVMKVKKSKVSLA